MSVVAMFPLYDPDWVQSLRIAEQVPFVWGKVVLSLYFPTTYTTSYTSGLTGHAQGASLVDMDEATLWLFKLVRVLPANAVTLPRSIDVDKAPKSFWRTVLIPRKDGWYFSGSLPRDLAVFWLAYVLARKNGNYFWFNYLFDAAWAVAKDLLKKRFELGESLSPVEIHYLYNDPWVSPELVWEKDGKLFVLNENRIPCDANGEPCSSPIFSPTLPNSLTVPEDIQRRWIRWAIQRNKPVPVNQWVALDKTPLRERQVRWDRCKNGVNFLIDPYQVREGKIFMYTMDQYRPHRRTSPPEIQPGDLNDLAWTTLFHRASSIR